MIDMGVCVCLLWEALSLFFHFFFLNHKKGSLVFIRLAVSIKGSKATAKPNPQLLGGGAEAVLITVPWE